MHQWRPLTDVLTDGAGSNRPSRFHQTRDIVENSGARLGIFQGEYPDRDLYDLILAKDPQPFCVLARRLADEWIDAEIELVAGDMLEGFCPTHDLCRMLINAACDRIQRETGRVMRNFEFPLETLRTPSPSEGAILVHMDSAQFARKRQAALTAYPALAGEVERLIRQNGEEAFRVETLLPATVPAGLSWEEAEPPYYEQYGHRQVAAGHYSELITYREHLQPLAHALHDWGVRGQLRGFKVACASS